MTHTQQQSTNPSPYQLWEKLIDQQLGSQQALNWQYDPEIPLKAYYEAENALDPAKYTALIPPNNLQTPNTPKQLLYFPLDTYNLGPNILRNYLAHWCDGIVLDLGKQVNTLNKGLIPYIKKILNENIQIAYTISAPNNTQTLRTLELLTQQLPTPNFIWNNAGHTMNWAQHCAHKAHKKYCIDLCPVYEAGPTWQIAYALAQLNEGLRQGQDPATLAKQLILVSTVETDFYHEIAKLRALRIGISKIFHAWGYPLPPWDLCLASIHNARTHSRLEPSNNLLRNATQTLSMLLGGVNYIIAVPHDITLGKKATEQGIRMTLNLKHLLCEEAQLNTLQDTVGGSYFFETLSYALGQAAWKRFQQIETLGGITQSTAQTQVQEAIAKGQINSFENRCTAKTKVIGANAFVANTLEPLNNTVPDGFVSTYTRHTAPFETLRWRSQQVFGKHPPTVSLIIHDNAQATEDAQRMQNLWACLGLATQIAPSNYTPDKESVYMHCLGNNIGNGVGNNGDSNQASQESPAQLLQAKAGRGFVLSAPEQLPKQQTDPLHAPYILWLDRSKDLWSLAQQIQPNLFIPSV